MGKFIQGTKYLKTFTACTKVFKQHHQECYQQKQHCYPQKGRGNKQGVKEYCVNRISIREQLLWYSRVDCPPSKQVHVSTCGHNKGTTLNLEGWNSTSGQYSRPRGVVCVEYIKLAGIVVRPTDLLGEDTWTSVVIASPQYCHPL